MKSNFFITLAIMAVSATISCSKTATTTSETAILQDSLENIASQYPGEIGIAVIIDRKDTVVVNNDDKYPLMSVFKLHQAMSLCHLFDETGTSLDTIIEIDRRDLDPHTWSPMLKDHPENEIKASVAELMRYTLIQSDNNASNLMFDRLQSVCLTDSFIATIIPRNSFRLSVTEAEMAKDHSLAYENHSSPLGVAMLIDRLFNDSLVSRSKQKFICDALLGCTTGTDRIVAPLTDKEGVTVGHKTGSGYVSPEGILAAHNDAAFITLPDGQRYTLVVLVKDFHGNEKQAAAAIAHVSECVYKFISRRSD